MAHFWTIRFRVSTLWEKHYKIIFFEITRKEVGVKLKLR